MNHERFQSTLSPLQITGAYLAFGLAWVALSDRVLFALVDSPVFLTQVQTMKGWGFVAASGVLLYVLTTYSYTRYRETTRELTETLQMTHVLHRILRHNLRNKCNVIAGTIDRLRPEGGVPAVAVIDRTTAELMELSEKSRLLRNVSLEKRSRVEVDLAREIGEVLTDVEESRPEAVVRTDVPDEAKVCAHPDVRQAIHELITNAIEHGGGAPVSVSVVEGGPDGTTIRVTDRGPGLPEMERAVLEEGIMETQTYHSRGLGLWLVRALATASDATVTVESENGQGTTVRLTFEPTATALFDWLLR